MAILYPTRIKKSNLGDILINILLVRELSKNDIVYLDGKPDEVIETLITTNNPYKENIRYHKTSFFLDGRPVFRWLRLVNIIPSLSVVFDPPGHYFEGGKLKTFLKTIKYIGRATLLRSQGIKMVRFGITLGPFSKNSWLIQKSLAKAYTLIGIRDKVNYSNLIEKGVQNLSLVDDVSLLYNPRDFIPQNRDLKEKYGEYVVVSFRGAIEGSITDEAYLDNVEKVFKTIVSESLADKNLTFLFTYQVSEDLPVIKQLLASLKDFNVKTILIEEQLDFTSAITLYNAAKYVFSNRLHVALLALLNNSPAYVITDIKRHHKLVNVYKDLGLDALLFDSMNSKSIRLRSSEELETVTENFRKAKNLKRLELEKSIANLVAKEK